MPSHDLYFEFFWMLGESQKHTKVRSHCYFRYICLSYQGLRKHCSGFDEQILDHHQLQNAMICEFMLDDRVSNFHEVCINQSR